MIRKLFDWINVGSRTPRLAPLLTPMASRTPRTQARPSVESLEDRTVPAYVFRILETQTAAGTVPVGGVSVSAKLQVTDLYYQRDAHGNYVLDGYGRKNLKFGVPTVITSVSSTTDAKGYVKIDLDTTSWKDPTPTFRMSNLGETFRTHDAGGIARYLFQYKIGSETFSKTLTESGYPNLEPYDEGRISPADIPPGNDKRPDGKKLPANTYFGLTFYDVRHATVSGKVFYDANGDGIQQPGEPPLKYKKLVGGSDPVYSTKYGSYSYRFVPESDPMFLPPIVDSTDFRGLRPTSHFDPVKIYSGSVHTNVNVGFLDIDLPKTRGAAGKFFLDLNNNGTFDSASSETYAGPVIFTNNGKEFVAKKSLLGQNGYVVEGLTPGQYTVRLKDYPGRSGRLIDTSAFVLITGNNPNDFGQESLTFQVTSRITRFDFRIVPLAGIYGTRFDDKNANRTFESGVDTPLANRTVQVDLGNNGTWDVTLTTNDHGIFGVNVPMGTHGVRELLNDGEAPAGPVSVIKTLAVGASYPPINFGTVPGTPLGKFAIEDASGDDTPGTAFRNGALRAEFDFGDLAPNGEVIKQVEIIAIKDGVQVPNFTPKWATAKSKVLFPLDGTIFAGGTYQFMAVAVTSSGKKILSPRRTMDVLTGGFYLGNSSDSARSYSEFRGQAVWIEGRGGIDTLTFGFPISEVASIDGDTPSHFDPTKSGQAIYRGQTVDYIRLKNKREIYFTGLEELKFTNRTITVRQTADDLEFDDQWNLHAMDVPGAWRFTKGSANVLLVSLDTGVKPNPYRKPESRGAITDIDTRRLITDPSDFDNGIPKEGDGVYGHGHSSISVMIGTADNRRHIAGINWKSNVYVVNVYSLSDGLPDPNNTLQAGIKAALKYARDHHLKAVFQGGIQGESWLTSGGTRAELNTLISSAAEDAFFAIAAGNGGPGGGLNDPRYLNSVSGVAKLEWTHGNVVSVGALLDSRDLAGYSNRGRNLTLVAPTDSPATNFQGDTTFGGTSCANPNLAAVASLVWSVNPNLTSAEIKQILIDTAAPTQIGTNTTPHNNTVGWGLVNAEAAVRRAAALARDPELANLRYTHRWILATP